MDISLFREPVDYPWSMLDGYDLASEKEGILTRVLWECVRAEKWVGVELGDHPVLLRTMVRDGLLENQSKENFYGLTDRSKMLLLKFYPKEADGS